MTNNTIHIRNNKMLKITLKRMLSVGLAFCVFGFVDNFLMIVAGDTIDKNIASVFGFSTMFAAGLGNTLSDFIGILSGRQIEHVVHGYFPPDDAAELSKPLIMTAEGIGIIIGCLFGMIPLFFM